MKIKTMLIAAITFSACLIVGVNIFLPDTLTQIPATQPQGVTKQGTECHNCTTKENQTRNRTLCIEENICKNNSSHKVYTYIRKPDFYHLTDKDINTTKVTANTESAVPDIVHYTWYGGLNKGNLFRFHHMMAILSVQKFLKPSRIYFWHDMVPTGEYWKEVNEKVPELCLVYRKTPTEIRGRRVYVAEHITDVVRLEAVMEYGGIYFDLDVMVVKSFDSLLKYDVVMGYESPGRLCSGVIIGKPWADFLKLWHQEYSSFTISQWDYHSVDVPSKLAKQFPNLIHAEEISLHRPNWRETDLLYEVGNIYDWKRNNYACHLWIKFHNVEHNSEDIRTWNTTVGEIWRWIYYGDWRLQLPGCILDNVCKDAGNSAVFNYSEHLRFIQEVESPIDFKLNINHTERVVPNIVHFTWYRLGNNTFRFHELVSILAAHKFIKPDFILFWHDVVPQGCYWEEVEEKVPELVLVYREVSSENLTQTVTEANKLFGKIVGLEAVLEYGGVYLDFDVIVLRPLDSLALYDVSVGYETDSVLSDGIIMGRAWAGFLRLYYKQITVSERNVTSPSFQLLSVLAKSYPSLVHTEALSMRGPTHEQLDQLYTERKLFDWRDGKDILRLWTGYQTREYNQQEIKYWNTTAAEVYRYVYYGDWRVMEVTEVKGKICIYGNICKETESDDSWRYIRLPTFMLKVDALYDMNVNSTHAENVVPNIVHFTWYGGHKKGNTFRFHHLITVLAAHKFLKPEAILFWHDMMPQGPHWKELKEKVPELKPVYRIAPSEIRGKKVAVAEHLTDVVRLEAVIEYGGFYFDLDAVVVKPLDIFRKHDVTMGYENNDGLCNGIIIGKPWAEFLRIWHGEYKTFDDNAWAYHSVTLPAKLAKKYPNLIHTERDSMHRPNWQEVSMLYDPGKLYDWRTKNNAVHLWIRYHKVEHNSTDIKTWNTTTGEIFRHVYYNDWRIMP